MASPNLQLEVENAIKDFVAIPGLTNKYAAHRREKLDRTGDYLSFIADPPKWDAELAELKVTFELATGGMTDHNKAAARASNWPARSE